MSLRGRIPDAEATYEDPVFGVNLHSSEEDLRAGESPNMKNMVRFGRLTNRNGMSRITATQIASAKAVTGGHKYYLNDGSTKKRLISYDTYVSTIADNGTEAKLWSTLTTGLAVNFNTWSITDLTYICNGTDDLMSYDGTVMGPANGKNLTSGVYKWTLSGSGTAEYYCEILAGGDPSITDITLAGGLWINGTQASGGTMSTLGPNQWDWGDNDTLGYSTVYYRMSDNSDPDAQASGFIWAGQSTTMPGVGGAAARQVIGVLDRLFAITSAGIERTDPRDANVWSVNSSWATFRPSQYGTFKAMRPHTMINRDGSPISGALAGTENSYYFFTGTDYGADVTAATDSTEDSAIVFIDNVGVCGPNSMVQIPSLGTFWLTPTKNVFYVPNGSVRGTFIGTKIVNTGGSSTTGLESMEITLCSKAWMVYSEPYLMLGYVETGGTYVTREWWLDLDRFRIDPRNPVWYGPMTDRTIGAIWPEQSQGDSAIVAGEGNSATGVFVYNVNVEDDYTDAVGTSDNDINCEISTYLKSGGAPSREKMVQGIEVEMTTTTGTASATADISDLHGVILSDIPLEKTFI